MKITRSACSLLLIITLLLGCTMSEETRVENDLLDNEKGSKLSILITDSSMNKYIKYFQILYPEVEINTTNATVLANKDPERANLSYNNLIEKVIVEQLNASSSPDIFLTNNPVEIHNLTQKGLLKPLDSYIEKSKYDMDGIAPFVHEGLRDLGGGTLYALSPVFSTSAIIYNKSIFDQKGIRYPTDRMTWEEIFNLAKQLSYEENGEQIYGLTIGFGNLYNTMAIYSSQGNLTEYDEEYKQIDVSSDRWKDIWNLFIELEREKIIAPTNNWDEYYRGDLFVAGKTAMQIISSSTVKEISIKLNQTTERNPTFGWDLVTVPVHRDRPDVGIITSYDGLMAIPVSAENDLLAWEFVSLLNSDKVAKQIAKTEWELVSRFEYNEEPSGMDVNLEAFSMLRPMSLTDSAVFFDRIGIEGAIEIQDIGNEEFQLARIGEKSVEQALNDYGERVQKILDRTHLENN